MKENAKSIPSMKRKKVVETDGITIVIAKICNHQQSKLATMILFSKIKIMNPTRLAHKFCTAAVIFLRILSPMVVVLNKKNLDFFSQSIKWVDSNDVFDLYCIGAPRGTWSQFL